MDLICGCHSEGALFWKVVQLSNKLTDGGKNIKNKKNPILKPAQNQKKRTMDKIRSWVFLLSSSVLAQPEIHEEKDDEAHGDEESQAPLSKASWLSAVGQGNRATPWNLSNS